MAFTSWNRFDDPGDCDIIAETLDPIIGAQSIRFRKTVGGANFNRHCNATPKDTSPLPNGLLAGRLRTLFYVNAEALSTSTMYASIICMQSVDDLQGSPGAAYILNVNVADSTARINKITGQSLNNSLGTTEAGPVGIGFTILSGSANVYSMELMWFSDISEFGGVVLQARFGQLQDYTDLAIPPGLDVIATSSPLTTSVSEGLGWHDGGTSGHTAGASIIYDKTQLYLVSLV